MITILRKRRSIRKYTARKIDARKLNVLKEAILRAPSSRDIQPCEFVFVSDKATLTQLSTAKQHGGEFLKNAALAIVVCGDEAKSDVWIEDCSIAAIIAQLAAQDLGLGSCWVQIRNRIHDAKSTAEQQVQKLLNLPNHLRVACILSVGFPGEIRKPVAKKKLRTEKIHSETF